MRAELTQRRKAIQDKIKENKTAIITYSKPLIDDGMGGLIEDPYGTPVADETRYVRLSHEMSTVPKEGTVPAGVSTNLQRFIISDYQTVITEGETFEAIGKEWRIGPVDTLYASGGIIGYQAPLMEAADLDEAEAAT